MQGKLYISHCGQDLFLNNFDQKIAWELVFESTGNCSV
jgi:hypothetical protein